MTNIEMWNMAKSGYAPMKLLLGTSIYSLGMIGGITSYLKSYMRGEINELTRLIYDARENAIGLINDEAKAIGADDVVGVKTYVYQLGGGLVEFLVIGTAVKKIGNLKTESEQLPPQAIVVDRETFTNATDLFSDVIARLRTTTRPVNNTASSFIGFIFVLIIFIVLQIFTH